MQFDQLTMGGMLSELEHIAASWEDDTSKRVVALVYTAVSSSTSKSLHTARRLTVSAIASSRPIASSVARNRSLSALYRWRAKTLPPKIAPAAAEKSAPAVVAPIIAQQCIACGAVAVRLSMCESCTHAVEYHDATLSSATDIECSGCRRAKRMVWDGAKATPADYPGRLATASGRR